jgi:hypothetical protein
MNLWFRHAFWHIHVILGQHLGRNARHFSGNFNSVQEIVFDSLHHAILDSSQDGLGHSRVHIRRFEKLNTYYQMGLGFRQSRQLVIPCLGLSTDNGLVLFCTCR